MTQVVRIGLECLLQDHLPLLRGRKIGLCCNPTTVFPDLRHAIDVLHAHPGLLLQRLFGPEHGVRGTAQYMVGVDNDTDSETGLPIVSLYGESEDSLRPSPESLAGLDLLIFDIQDIGSRYYTYIYTLAYCLEACAEQGIPIIVCDRPNPIGGIQCEGNIVDIAHYRSFVGRFPLPNRHGLTVGELAKWFQAQMQLPTDKEALQVIPCQGWQRAQRYEQSGLPWVMPSPNMPNLETALVYPGQCLLEGTNVSEGRGTTRPFELIGAPWIHGATLQRALQQQAEKWHLQGITFRSASIEPTFQKYAGQICQGVQFHITDPQCFEPLATSVALLLSLRKLYPDDFDWRTEAYEFISNRLAIDLLSGDTSIRELVDGNGELPELQAIWRQCEQNFQASVEEYLLYT